MKNKLLKVKKRTLKKYGAVSWQVVKEMAEGILKISQSDFSIAVSGIAGPTGGTPQKPVGTVWICAMDKDGAYSIKKFLFNGTRNEVQLQSVEAAWKLLWELTKRLYG